MAIKRLKVEVTIINEYIVEIDEDIYNEAWEKEFSQAIHSFEGDRFKGIAKDLVWNQVIGDDEYVEGYGSVKVDGKVHWSVNATEGLNIIPLSEFEDVDYDIEVLK